MSDLFFPTLPESIRVIRTVEYAVSEQKVPSGKRLAIRRRIGGLRRYILSFEALLVTGVAQVATFLDFVDAHGGSFESFQFVDPLDGSTRRVQFVSNAIELERVSGDIWAAGEVELLEVVV